MSGHYPTIHLVQKLRSTAPTVVMFLVRAVLHQILRGNAHLDDLCLALEQLALIFLNEAFHMSDEALDLFSQSHVRDKRGCPESGLRLLHHLLHRSR